MVRWDWLERVPEQSPAGALSVREREVVARVAKGHSNKLIAASLRIATSTVATYVARARRKLGATNASLLLQALSSVSPSNAPTRLTPSERAVARLAAEGLSNHSIAEHRRCSVHTVAKQLSSAYLKLGGATRRALHAFVLEPKEPPPPLTPGASPPSL